MTLTHSGGCKLSSLLEGTTRSRTDLEVCS
jgi:hypothetical protein